LFDDDEYRAIDLFLCVENITGPFRIVHEFENGFTQLLKDLFLSSTLYLVCIDGDIAIQFLRPQHDRGKKKGNYINVLFQ
jgi:hypothetical protein